MATLGVVSLLALGCTGLTIDGDAPVDCSGVEAAPIQPLGGLHAVSSCGGIQGDAWTATDGHSTMSARTTDRGVCVDGQIAQVVGKNYTAYWGAAVGINLNQPTNQPAKAYDADRNGVEGFYFELMGTSVPPSTRLRAQLIDMNGANFCHAGVGAGESLLLGEFKQDCFATTPGSPPNRAQLSSVAVAITAADAAPLSYSLCVGFTALLTGGG
jgi:hypothetical protein